nr:leucine-rich repeat domain-containing protein [Pseudomonadota bacterium]
MSDADDDTGTLALVGYEKLADHGFALPCFAQAVGANTTYAARSAADARGNIAIAGFDLYDPAQLVRLQAEQVRPAEVGAPWLHVFLWQERAYIGTAADIWSALHPVREDIARCAPVSLLALAGEADLPVGGYARDAFLWLTHRYGRERAIGWRSGTYLRGIVVRSLRAQLGDRAATGPVRRALQDVHLVESEAGLTLRLPETLATAAGRTSSAFALLTKAARDFRLVVTSIELVGPTKAEPQRSLPADPVPPVPPPDFDLDRVRQMVLAGEAPPADWRPFILALDFQETGLRQLAPLAGLTALQNLNLWNTRVRDVAPLAGLSALRSLVLGGAQVSDVAPLAGLAALQSLDLSFTQVSDAVPLARLTALQNLTLSNTQVSDAAPLAGLTALQSLDLGG